MKSEPSATSYLGNTRKIVWKIKKNPRRSSQYPSEIPRDATNSNPVTHSSSSAHYSTVTWSKNSSPSMELEGRSTRSWIHIKTPRNVTYRNVKCWFPTVGSWQASRNPYAREALLVGLLSIFRSDTSWPEGGKLLYEYFVTVEG
jgi:hypothetical protein